MWVVIWLVVALAGLTAVLSVPLDLVLRVEVSEKPQFKLRLEWLFGIVRKDIRTEKKPGKEKKRTREGRNRARAIFEIIRIKGMPRRFIRLAKAIIGHLKVKELIINLRVGLDNPADTAILLGFIESLRLFWKPPFPHKIDIIPDYEGEVFLEGYAQLVVRVLPALLVVPLVKFICSRSAIRAVKILVRNR